jgi:hypothetical protein
MNVAGVISRLAVWAAEAPPGTVLLARCTALLGLAWLAHAALARRDPRWRVALWRSAAAGLAALVVLAAVPPVVAWPVERIEPRLLRS